MSRVKIGGIAKLYRGVSYKKEQARKIPCNGYVAILRANNITSGGFNFDDLVYLPLELVAQEQYINQGDIIITMSSGSKAHVGKVAIATRPMSHSYGAFCAKIVPTGVLPKFLCYVLRSAKFRTHIEQQCKGTNINNIKQSYILDYEIDLPALPEQERIVARIEELFSQLDSGVETLKRIKQQLVVYRQAVLKEAFKSTGKKCPIREMASLVTSGSRGWAQFYADKGARFIRITDLTRDKICLKNDNLQYVLLPDNAEGKRSRLIENDVLVSITADLGSIALIPKTIGEAYINQHIAMIRFNNPTQGEYMAWYLKSDFGQKDLLKNKRGGGKLGLGLDDIRDTPVPVVSDNEAKSTTELIDSRMSVCDSIEETVDTALQQAEAMRQSILKQAFERGLL